MTKWSVHSFGMQSGRVWQSQGGIYVLLVRRNPESPNLGLHVVDGFGAPDPQGDRLAGKSLDNYFACSRKVGERDGKLTPSQMLSSIRVPIVDTVFSGSREDPCQS